MDAEMSEIDILGIFSVLKITHNATIKIVWELLCDSRENQCVALQPYETFSPGQ
jgi:hypothetical protein